MVLPKTTQMQRTMAILLLRLRALLREAPLQLRDQVPHLVEAGPLDPQARPAPRVRE